MSKCGPVGGQGPPDVKCGPVGGQGPSDVQVWACRWSGTFRCPSVSL